MIWIIAHTLCTILYIIFILSCPVAQFDSQFPIQPFLLYPLVVCIDVSIAIFYVSFACFFIQFLVYLLGFLFMLSHRIYVIVNYRIAFTYFVYNDDDLDFDWLWLKESKRLMSKTFAHVTRDLLNGQLFQSMRMIWP